VEVLQTGIKEYLHQFCVNFEHEIGSGGGSGDSGGSLEYIIYGRGLNLEV
jgi:hypothetical protein